MAASSQSVNDRWVFMGLLGLVVWAPMPLGSNRTWAIGLLLVFALVLLGGTVLAWRCHADAALDRLKLFRWPLGLLLLMVVLSWAQTVVLPASWVEAISPMAAAAQVPAEFMTLSLDVYQSRLMASLAFVYFMVFVVVLLVVRHAQRLERLAEVLVFSGVVQAVLGTLGLLVGLTLAKVLQVIAKRKSSLPWGMAFGVAMAMVALLVHSTVDFNLQIPANALTIVVILAMGWIAHALPSPRAGQKTSRKETNE